MTPAAYPTIIAGLLDLHSKPVAVQAAMLTTAIGACGQRLRVESVATDRYPPGGAPKSVQVILRMEFEP